MLSRRRPCLAPAIATATIAVALLVSRSARADVDRNSPIVSDSDPRLIGNYRASGQLITTAPCQTTPCEGPRAGAAGTREVPKVVAPKNGAPSLVTRVKTALTEPVDVPPLVNAAIQLPGTVSRGFFSQAADFVKDTVGFVVDTDVAIVKSVAGLSTGNLGATERAVTSSQVAQMVKGTVQNTTTTVRMASAAITDNDEALAHAALESPMFPLVMQASVEAPRIVNTIRSGTSEERAQLLTEGGELYGRLGFEATLFAVPGGGAVRAPSLAVRTSRLAETAARTSRLADRELVARNDNLVTNCKGELCKPDQATNCFAAGTPVLTPDGERQIEDIRTGDLVLSRNPETFAVEPHRVARTFVTTDHDVVELGLDTGGGHESFVVTPGHPFYVEGRGFTQVGDLTVGDIVVTASGSARVEHLLSLTRSITVYNFEVETDHTYFVGRSAVWVHNDCGAGSVKLGPDGRLAGPLPKGVTPPRNLVDVAKAGPEGARIAESYARSVDELALADRELASAYQALKDAEAQLDIDGDMSRYFAASDQADDAIRAGNERRSRALADVENQGRLVQQGHADRVAQARAQGERTNRLAQANVSTLSNLSKEELETLRNAPAGSRESLVYQAFEQKVADYRRAIEEGRPEGSDLHSPTGRKWEQEKLESALRDLADRDRRRTAVFDDPKLVSDAYSRGELAQASAGSKLEAKKVLLLKDGELNTLNRQYVYHFVNEGMPVQRLTDRLAQLADAEMRQSGAARYSFLNRLEEKGIRLEISEARLDNRAYSWRMDGQPLTRSYAAWYDANSRAIIVQDTRLTGAGVHGARQVPPGAIKVANADPRDPTLLASRESAAPILALIRQALGEK